MHAQQLGMVAGLGLGLLDLLDAPQGLLRRVGEHAGQPAGGALTGKEFADGVVQLVGGGRVHVHPGAAVGMYVDEAGHQALAAQIQHLAARRGVHPGRHLGDGSVLDQDLPVLKTVIVVDPCVFDHKFHDWFPFCVLPPLRRAAWPRWRW